MNRIPKKNYRKIAVLLIVFNFFSLGGAFGQSVLQDQPAFYDPEIFPFASGFSEEQPADAGQDTIDPSKYTEDVLQITDNGVLDSSGNPVRPSLPDIQASEEDNITIDDSSIDALNQAASSQDALEAYKESIIANWGGKVEFTKHRLQDLQDNLQKETDAFNDLDKQINDIEDKMAPTRQQINTLQDEINLMNQQLNLAQKKIQNTDLMIAEKEVILRNLMEEYKRSEIQLNTQKETVLNYILLVYNEQQNFVDFSNGSSSTIKLLLADKSISENMLGLEYSTILEETGRKVFYDLHDRQVELKNKQDRIDAERANLDSLKVSLEQEKRLLAEGKTAKNNLLTETQGKEEEYQRLLEESRQQQLESAMAIQNMKDNIEFINQKLNLLDDSLDKVQSLTSVPEQPAADQPSVTETQESDNAVQDIQGQSVPEAVTPDVEKYDFIWPVPPDRGVSAYFHDSSYPKKWGVHQAIDIRAKQYTEIHAPANGYVFQTKDNGMGYSYIILAHKNKMVTVYGHVTQILVKAGTMVKQGDVIGLSGGTPGTKGAGWQTTGPHLHFEVWHNGVQVDPLDYLPVMQLPIEYIPDRFLKAEEMSK